MRQDPENKSRLTGVVITVIFLVVVPLIAHFLFSWMGFNPTDDGFTLAYSRRIIEGEIPHRDFIIIRPFLSPLLHVPFVLWGGAYTFWLSRLFVWSQLAGISLLWVSIIGRLLLRPFGAPARFALALIAFAASAHDFPIMAWHTIDGLLLVSLGLWICVGRKDSLRWPGYLLIGMACLCKQNFALMVPATLFFLGDWRKIRYWIAAAVPMIFYCAYIAASGAAADALVQLSSHGELLSTGVNKYIKRWTPVWIFIGYFALHYLHSLPGKKAWIRETGRRRLVGLTGLYGLPLLTTVISLVSGYLFRSSFVLFGVVTGILLYCLVKGRWKFTNELRGVSIVLTAAWCVSISLGYNSPALMAGPLFVLILLADRIVGRLSSPLIHCPAFLFAVTAATVIGFGIGRCTHIYRDRPAVDLTERLGDVLEGGRLIKTNQNTFRYLADLQGVINSVDSSGLHHILLPGSAGVWVKSKQRNPLPIDWVQETELKNNDLVNDVRNDIDISRNSTVVIVQKVILRALADEFEYVADSNYHELVRYVRDNYTKVRETPYHEIYR